MRIVIATLYGYIGGSSKVLLAAAGALRQEHTIIVRAPFAAADAVMPRALPPATLDSWGSKLAALPLLLRLLVQEWAWVRRTRPDTIYVHDDISLYLYGIVAKLRGIRLVRHVHMRDGEGWARRVRDVLSGAKIFVARFVAGQPQRRRWAVIRNPVEIARLPVRSRGEILHVGLVGSISRTKNQDFAVSVAAELLKSGHPFRLQIFGDALDEDYRNAVASRIAELGLERHVTLRGFVPAAEAFREIDVLLSCSIYESFGLATVEALGAGVPVVASDIEGHRELAAILDTPALMLVPFSPAVAAAALLAVHSDPAAPQRVAAEFSPERFGAELRELFRTGAAPLAVIQQNGN